jgi:type IV secretory pathway ATPase VirB11/archaellum biosynthesis ATPase
MLFKENSPVYATEVERQQGESILYVNFLGASFVPSIAGDGNIMAKTIDLLGENSGISRVVFIQQRNYDYSYEQISMLNEISQLYNFLVKQEGIFSPEKMSLFGNSAEVYNELSGLMASLKTDPIYCYLTLKRRISELRKQLESGQYYNKNLIVNYLRFFEKFFILLESTILVKKLLGSFSENSLSDREIYSKIFRPNVLPNFTFTRLMAQIPDNVELIDQYTIEQGFEKINISILKKKDNNKYIYHILPEEYLLSEEHHLLVNMARNVLSEHRPKAEEFTDPERTRQVFFNVASDLLRELSQSKGIVLSYNELNKLAGILVRYTIGFGLLEVLLMDNRLQDIVLNAPISLNPVFVRHEKYDECATNIMPSFEDADSWAAKLRLQSGRPLDEANPILDTEISFGKIRARVAAVKEPLSPSGLAYALRRHRDEPWTLPLFIHNKMINSFTAGLLSFLIDGARTLLVAGTRSSGKTSLLGALLLEVMPRYRVIVVEDTLELPVDSMRKLGYDILRMKVRSALVSGSTEIEASEGIRTSLRLGDSALIVGEVRSSEAKALYEAMRVGALANVVAGTIHGDSPYGVFDRVVNDLDVQPTSFKATDLIMVANPIRTADGLHSIRRVISLTEVRKHWTKDPLEEGGFVDLLKYNVEKDELEPTQDLINGDSEIIKSIAANVQGWAGNWDAVYDNIILRGMVKQEIVEMAVKLKKPILMESEFNTLSNAVFHRISEEVRKEHGLPMSDKVFPIWKKWLDKTANEF